MTVTISVEIDAKVKESATKILDSMGLDHGELLGMFYRQFVAEGKLPVQIEREVTAREKLSGLIKERIASGEISVTRIEANEHGELIIDKDRHPELYDWAVNG